MFEPENHLFWRYTTFPSVRMLISIAGYIIPPGKPWMSPLQSTKKAQHSPRFAVRWPFELRPAIFGIYCGQVQTVPWCKAIIDPSVKIWLVKMRLNPGGPGQSRASGRAGLRTDFLRHLLELSDFADPHRTTSKAVTAICRATTGICRIIMEACRICMEPTNTGTCRILKEILQMIGKARTSIVGILVHNALPLPLPNWSVGARYKRFVLNSPAPRLTHELYVRKDLTTKSNEAYWHGRWLLWEAYPVYSAVKYRYFEPLWCNDVFCSKPRTTPSIA